MKENKLFLPILKIVAPVIFLILAALGACAQNDQTAEPDSQKVKRIFYGEASFYANKFHGRTTANGEIFNNEKFTAACNILPLGTWIRVTNLKNGKKVTVKTTDRLHPRMRRLIDLSYAGAKKLGYVKQGLTRVRVEVINKKKFR